MTLTYRPATRAELSGLQALAARTFPDAAPDYIPHSAIDAFIAENLSLASFENYLESANYLLSILEKEGALVGYTLLDVSKSHNPPEAPEAAYLSKFYLAAEARGTGAARIMMDELFKQVRQQGFSSIWLGTAKENLRSNAFYEKVGFEVIGERQFEVAPGIFGDDWLRAVRL